MLKVITEFLQLLLQLLQLPQLLLIVLTLLILLSQLILPTLQTLLLVIAVIKLILLRQTPLTPLMVQMEATLPMEPRTEPMELTLLLDPFNGMDLFRTQLQTTVIAAIKPVVAKDHHNLNWIKVSWMGLSNPYPRIQSVDLLTSSTLWLTKIQSIYQVHQTLLTIANQTTAPHHTTKTLLVLTLKVTPFFALLQF